MNLYNLNLLAVVFYVIIGFVFCQNGHEGCLFPSYIEGTWYYTHMGLSSSITVQEDKWGEDYKCMKVHPHPKSSPNMQERNHTFLLKSTDEISECFYCLDVLWRTPNVLQFQMGICIVSMPETTLDDCPGVVNLPTSEKLITMFREDPVTGPPCGMPFDGSFQFAYQTSIGGGGICDNKDSSIIPDPNDKTKFNMIFERCDNVDSSIEREIRYQCYGRWQALIGMNNYMFIAISSAQHIDIRERFKCLITKDDQKDLYGTERMAMSRFADCSRLNSIYNGPLRLVFRKVCAWELIREQAFEECLDNFSTFFSSVGELDSGPIYDNEDMMIRLCSAEGKAATKCVLEYVKTCPSVADAIHNTLGLNVKNIVDMKGIDRTCYIFRNSCSEVKNCYTTDKLQSIEMSLKTSSTGESVDYSTLSDQYHAFCGPLKKLYDCLDGQLESCGVDQEELAMLLKTYGSTKDYTLNNKTVKFIMEGCDGALKVPGDSTCVQAKLKSQNFSDCLNSTKTSTGKCQQYELHTACIRTIIGSECGDESADYLIRTSQLVDQDLPVECYMETSFAVRNQFSSVMISCLLLFSSPVTK